MTLLRAPQESSHSILESLTICLQHGVEQRRVQTPAVYVDSSMCPICRVRATSPTSADTVGSRAYAGFESQLCHLLCGYLRANHSIYPSCSFLTYQAGKKISTTFRSCDGYLTHLLLTALHHIKNVINKMSTE